MPDRLMYEEDAFVLLETGQPEQILTPQELADRLRAVVLTLQEDLPRDLRKFGTIEEQVDYLMNTCCDLDLGPGRFLQWYVVRLEK